MSNPNPEEFAKNVLWHLAGMRAEISALRVRIYSDMASRLPKEQDTDAFLAQMQAYDHGVIVKMQDELYLAALAECKIPPAPESGEAR